VAGGDVDRGLAVDGVGGEGWTSIPTLLISSLSAEMLDSRPGGDVDGGCIYPFVIDDSLPKSLK